MITSKFTLVGMVSMVVLPLFDHFHTVITRSRRRTRSRIAVAALTARVQELSQRVHGFRQRVYLGKVGEKSIYGFGFVRRMKRG